MPVYNTLRIMQINLLQPTSLWLRERLPYRIVLLWDVLLSLVQTETTKQRTHTIGWVGGTSNYMTIVSMKAGNACIPICSGYLSGL